MKKSFVLLWLFISNITLYSQTTVYFDYDAAGNRTYRGASQKKSTSSQAEENAPTDSLSERIGKYEITLFPNPVDQQMVIKINGLEDGQQAKLALYNISGKQVIIKTTIDPMTLLDFTDYPAGPYILKIIIAAESTEWKIIKE